MPEETDVPAAETPQTGTETEAEPKASADPVKEPEERMVPYDRFQKVNEERKALKTELERARQEHADREEESQRRRDEAAAQHEEMRRKLEALEAEHKAAVEELQRFRDRAQSAVEARLKALPEKVRALAPETDDVLVMDAWLEKAAVLAEEPAGSPKPGTPKSPAPAAPAGKGKRDEEALRAQMSLYR